MGLGVRVRLRRHLDGLSAHAQPGVGKCGGQRRQELRRLVAQRRETPEQVGDLVRVRARVRLGVRARVRVRVSVRVGARVRARVGVRARARVRVSLG